jgi:dephospho-CoA kinase
MLNVGLTGNIAAGKSTVVGLFRRWGATIVDADQLAREAQSPGSDVLTAIAKRFGADVIAADGSLDRAGLRAKVMGDDAALAALNALVHPAVRRRRDELVREARERGDALVVNDIPLLFEALDPTAFDAVVLVDAPPALRRARLQTLRGLSAEEADRMIAAQMPAQRKRSQSAYVIENDATLADLEARARRVFEDLRRRAAATGALRWRSLLLVSANGGDQPELIAALTTRAIDAGIPVRRAAGRAALVRELKSAPPDVTLATPAAAQAARAAWADAGKPGALRTVTEGAADAPGLPLDLRPWGAGRVRLEDNPLP